MRDAPDPEPPPADTPADALEVTTLIEGSGAAASPGDQLVVHYVGKLADGSVFDASWGRGEPFALVVGQGMVIAGWDEGLVGAQAGERRRLVIGHQKAYGERGTPGGPIPPRAPLVFEVDVIEIVAGS
jgi:peptidylprolyl isomerase